MIAAPPVPKAAARPASPTSTRARPGLLQRKCACGGTPGPSGECEECRKKRLNVQRRDAHETESAILDRAPYAMPDSTSRPAYNFATVPVHARSPLSIQTKLAISQPAEQAEQEADRAAEQLTRAEARAASDRNEPPRLSAAQPRVQRQQVDEAPASPTETTQPPEPATPETMPEPTAPGDTPTAGLLQEDEATELSPGQMKKSEFLDALRTSVCAAADVELAAVGRSTEGCPYIEYWIGYYGTRSSDYIERAIRKYAPETTGVTTAGDYIPLITERMRQGVATWAMTGRITGVPEELAGQVPEMGGAPAGAASPVSGVESGIGGLLFKARDGGAREADPEAIQSQLRSGSPLDSGVKARMESAFGHDFSSVRVHTDVQATGLSSSLNARAFTIGSDIAFGPGEYQPGTLIGDALLAHELAHVVQQGGAASANAPLQKGENAYNSLEEDADNSAVGAVVSLWSGAERGLANIAQNAMPRLRSGLGLQRCSRTSSPPCANPGNQRSVDLQPVFFSASAADPSPTGSHWTTNLSRANTIWGKLGVSFTALTPITLTDATNKTRGTNLTETQQVAATRSGAGVEVFMVDNELAWTGGARTFDLGSANAKTVLTDRPGTADTIMAHELGHVLGLGHPGMSPPLDVESNTIMDPTGSFTAANPTRNPISNYNHIRFPAPGAATCLQPDP